MSERDAVGAMGRANAALPSALQERVHVVVHKDMVHALVVLDDGSDHAGDPGMAVFPDRRFSRVALDEHVGPTPVDDGRYEHLLAVANTYGGLTENKLASVVWDAVYGNH